MRRRKETAVLSDCRILIVDDDIGIINSLSVVLQRRNYTFSSVTSPLEAVEKVRMEHYDMLILDYLMPDICGDEVVRRIREFNEEIYILLLTGHKDLLPPLEAVKKLDIQGYCEKSDKFDHLLLLVESAIKSISQMRTINRFKDGLGKMLKVLPRIYSLQPVEDILAEILDGIMYFIDCNNAFILIGDINTDISGNKNYIYKSAGRFKVQEEDFFTVLGQHLAGHVRAMKSILKPLKVDKGILFPVLNGPSKTRGVIYVEDIETEEDLKLLSIYSTQASSSINNAYQHSVLDSKNDKLNKTHDELKDRYVEAIEALHFIVDAMVSDKQYKSRMELDEARMQLVKGMSTQFNKAVVEKFMKVLENYDQIED